MLDLSVVTLRWRPEHSIPNIAKTLGPDTHLALFSGVAEAEAGEKPPVRRVVQRRLLAPVHGAVHRNMGAVRLPPQLLRERDTQVRPL